MRYDGSQSRPPLKEKFVEISEALFRGEASYAKDPITFWDVYLLLPVNAQCIRQLVKTSSAEALFDAHNNLSRLFEVCLDKMNTVATGSDQTRQLHALNLLSCLFRGLFAKKRLSCFNIIHILTGIDKADAIFGNLVKSLGTLLSRQQTRTSALRLALILSAGNENVNQNTLNGTLFEIIADTESSEDQVRDAVMLFGMLSNYNKYEARNPYLNQLHSCKNNGILERIAYLFVRVFEDMIISYIELKDDEETLAKSVASYMTQWFSGPLNATGPDIDSVEALVHLPPPQSALLLVLYDLINGNPHFITILLQICKQADVNPLGALLSFASYLFQHNRNDRSFIYTRLLLLILLRLTEENSVLNYMAREESSVVVRLCRQRSPSLPRMKKPRSPLSVVLDVCLSFLKYNMRKKLDLTTYKLTFSIMHHVLCFLHKRRIQLGKLNKVWTTINWFLIKKDYHWAELWSTLMSTLHFTVLNLEDLQTREEFSTCLAMTFLSDTKSYDALFYEVIRATNEFTALAQFVHRTFVGKSQTLSFSDFSNIRLICNHFNPALEEWQASHPTHSLTPEQVLGIINENYNTLELIPMEKLDHYAPYNEIPTEMGFFCQLLRTCVSDYPPKEGQ
ncbi:hypothetical protein DFQ29_009532 [Apophysomyces sp. BC1021]|nr:hypothetical protein DFQ29_009532 [Apophysomyces sp. BC1021]